MQKTGPTRRKSESVSSSTKQAVKKDKGAKKPVKKVQSQYAKQRAKYLKAPAKPKPLPQSTQNIYAKPAGATSLRSLIRSIK